MVPRLEDALQQLGLQPMDCNPRKMQRPDDNNTEVSILVSVANKYFPSLV